MDFTGLNSNPVVFDTTANVRKALPLDEEDDEDIDEVDTMEIFDLIRDIKDPEHDDLTLEALNVLRLTNVTVDNAHNKIHIFFTPTGAGPVCHMGAIDALKQEEAAGNAGVQYGRS